MPKHNNTSTNKKPTAAIYDRWLSTLGGGEQVVFAYAEALKELGYAVTLLSHAPIDTERAEKKMGVSLQDIQITYLPYKSSRELSEYTEQYDLFINSSYLDYFPNRSKMGILSIFFPSEIYLSPYEFVKRALIIPSFRLFFIYPLNYEDFLYDEYTDNILYKWLGTASTIVFTKAIRKVSLDLFFETLEFSVLEQIQFLLNEEPIQPISKKLDHRNNIVTYTFDLKQGLSSQKNLKIVYTSLHRAALIRLTIPSIRYVLYNLFKHFFPKWEMRLHGGPGVTKRSDLESYQKLITISDFCKKWITIYWGLHSEILYPPVNTKNFQASTHKKNHIIHVGRFFVSGHNKKQLDLIKVFKNMVDAYKIPNWELHFIGSVHEGAEHAKYFENCQDEARNYPIFFHTDVPFVELMTRLSEAKIYWHATGLDQNEDKEPILFEHFGITTVEAMASGCVPVVIKAGGQKEIVTKDSGFLWSSRRELTEQTMHLITNPDELATYSTGAQERSVYFDRKNFKKRFEKILQQK